MQSTLYPESVVFSTAFTVCFLSDLLFFSIQQKKRLEWLGSIHFKPIKALIRNHNIQKKGWKGNSERTFLRSGGGRALWLDTSYILPHFSLKYKLGSRSCRSKTFPECIKLWPSRQFWRTRLLQLANVEFLCLKFSLFSFPSFFSFSFLMRYWAFR